MRELLLVLLFPLCASAAEFRLQPGNIIIIPDSMLLSSTTAGVGTVISVSGTSTAPGLAITGGPFTSAGTLTLSGTPTYAVTSGTATYSSTSGSSALSGSASLSGSSANSGKLGGVVATSYLTTTATATNLKLSVAGIGNTFETWLSGGTLNPVFSSITGDGGGITGLVASQVALGNVSNTAYSATFTVGDGTISIGAAGQISNVSNPSNVLTLSGTQNLSNKTLYSNTLYRNGVVFVDSSSIVYYPSTAHQLALGLSGTNGALALAPGGLFSQDLSTVVMSGSGVLFQGKVSLSGTIYTPKVSGTTLIWSTP